MRDLEIREAGNLLEMEQSGIFLQLVFTSIAKSQVKW